MTGAARWKNQERFVAAALGGVRLPNIGAGQCDVRAPGWAVQVKTRATLPAWLWEAMAQAERDAAPYEAPVVVLAEVVPGRKTRRVVVMDFDRFAALVAGGGAAQTGTDRAPPATPAATMATQHRGDRPKPRPQQADRSSD